MAEDQRGVDEGARAALEYFNGNEPPLCPRCGEELQFRVDYSAGHRLCLSVSCPGCGCNLNWRQPDSPGEWAPLHLTYFVERIGQGDVPRCPFDDSGVSFAEFEGGVLEFRCQFCNRRGRTTAPVTSDMLHSDENESIVFLIV